MLGDLVTAAGARGMHVDAWTVFLHVDRTEHGHPASPSRRASATPADPAVPGQPDVRRYARHARREVARRGVGAVIAESLHHHPLEHGYHHERYFVALGRWRGRCSGSASAALLEARAALRDPPELRRRACAEVDGRSRATPRRRRGEPTRAEAASMLDGHLGAPWRRAARSSPAGGRAVAAASAERARASSCSTPRARRRATPTGRPEGERRPRSRGAWASTSRPWRARPLRSARSPMPPTRRASPST